MYHAIVEPTNTGFSAYFPDILGLVTTGATLEAVKHNLSEVLGVYLAECAFEAQPVEAATAAEGFDLSESEQGAFTVAISPAQVNTVSLEIEYAMRAQGVRPAELARRTGMKSSNVARLTDPFYFGHSIDSLRRVAQALGVELSVTLQPSARTVPVSVLEWLDRLVPQDAEARAIEVEEQARYNLAIALSNARKASGLTPTQLAKKMRVPRETVERFEKVYFDHTLETLLNICDAVGANLVLGLEVKGELIPVTPAAECCVVLQEETCEALKTRAARAERSIKDELTALFAPRQQPLQTRAYSEESVIRFSARGHTHPNQRNLVKANAA